MEATFSEFSYGYALTEELASGKWGTLIGTPIFPSLRKEGQSGGGYDVQLPLMGTPLFLQFKLSHYLHRSNALEWSLFNSPYYRMYLRPLKYSNQHELLMTLEQNNIGGVFYVAPEFYLAHELNEAYLSKNVCEKSAYFSPCDIGSLPDDGPHYVVFGRSNAMAYLCSEEPKTVSRFYYGEVFWESQLSRLRQRKSKVNEVFFEEISYRMADTIQKRISSFDQMEIFQNEVRKKRETLREKAQFAAYLARAYFDAELFIIAEQDDIP